VNIEQDRRQLAAGRKAQADTTKKAASLRTKEADKRTAAAKAREPEHLEWEGRRHRRPRPCVSALTGHDDGDGITPVDVTVAVPKAEIAVLRGSDVCGQHLDEHPQLLGVTLVRVGFGVVLALSVEGGSGRNRLTTTAACRHDHVQAKAAPPAAAVDQALCKPRRSGRQALHQHEKPAR
jgi:hypothetical protein